MDEYLVEMMDVATDDQIQIAKEYSETTGIPFKQALYEVLNCPLRQMLSRDKHTL